MFQEKIPSGLVDEFLELHGRGHRFPNESTTSRLADVESHFGSDALRESLGLGIVYAPVARSRYFPWPNRRERSREISLHNVTSPCS